MQPSTFWKSFPSFAALQHCLAYPIFSARMSLPRLLITALLLGPLDGLTVEHFVSNRTEPFRAEIRKLLLMV
jgi:hypothetical protein